jgi:hypothetical protein
MSSCVELEHPVRLKDHVKKARCATESTVQHFMNNVDRYMCVHSNTCISIYIYIDQQGRGIIYRAWRCNLYIYI